MFSLIFKHIVFYIQGCLRVYENPRKYLKHIKPRNGRNGILHEVTNNSPLGTK